MTFVKCLIVSILNGYALHLMRSRLTIQLFSAGTEQRCTARIRGGPERPLLGFRGGNPLVASFRSGSTRDSPQRLCLAGWSADRWSRNAGEIGVYIQPFGDTRGRASRSENKNILGKRGMHKRKKPVLKTPGSFVGAVPRR